MELRKVINNSLNICRSREELAFLKIVDLALIFIDLGFFFMEGE